MVLSFAFVIILLFVAVKMFAKYVKNGTVGMRESKFMRIVDTIAVGQDRYIMIVEINNSYYLIGSTASEISILSELDGSDIENQLTNLKNPTDDLKSFSNALLERMKKK